MRIVARLFHDRETFGDLGQRTRKIHGNGAAFNDGNDDDASAAAAAKSDPPPPPYPVV